MLVCTNWLDYQHKEEHLNGWQRIGRGAGKRGGGKGVNFRT